MRMYSKLRYGSGLPRPDSGRHELIDAKALFVARGKEPMSKLDELKSRATGGIVIEAARRFRPDYDPAAIAKDAAHMIASSPPIDFDNRTGQGKLL